MLSPGIGLLSSCPAPKLGGPSEPQAAPETHRTLSGPVETSVVRQNATDCISHQPLGVSPLRSCRRPPPCTALLSSRTRRADRPAFLSPSWFCRRKPSASSSQPSSAVRTGPDRSPKALVPDAGPTGCLNCRHREGNQSFILVSELIPALKQLW